MLVHVEAKLLIVELPIRTHQPVPVAARWTTPNPTIATATATDNANADAVVAVVRRIIKGKQVGVVIVNIKVEQIVWRCGEQTKKRTKA